MRNEGGYLVVFDPDGPTIERSTATCNHCSIVMIVNPRLAPEHQAQDRVIEPDRCRLCMRHICPVCAGKGGCDPFEKKLEAIERADRLMRALG